MLIHRGRTPVCHVSLCSGTYAWGSFWHSVSRYYVRQLHYKYGHSPAFTGLRYFAFATSSWVLVICCAYNRVDNACKTMCSTVICGIVVT